jgi:uncharacterized protein YegP (UPF0339 family)
MISRYDYYLDHAGEWRWTAIANNGEPIAVSSEGYKHLSDCLHAIDLMKGSAPAAVVMRDTRSRLANALVGNVGPELSMARFLMRRNKLLG